MENSRTAWANKLVAERVKAGMKRCMVCKKVRRLTSFHKAKDRGDGLQVRCKKCQCAAVRRSAKKHNPDLNRRTRAKPWTNIDAGNIDWDKWHALDWRE